MGCKCGPLAQPRKRHGVMGRGGQYCGACGADMDPTGFRIKWESECRQVRQDKDPYLDSPDGLHSHDTTEDPGLPRTQEPEGGM